MPTDQDLHDAILEAIGPGSRTPTSLAQELDVDERDLKLAIYELLQDDVVEEHTQINGAYRRTD